MDLDTFHCSKADFLLQRALAGAQSDEVLRVLLYLAAMQELVQRPAELESTPAEAAQEAWPVAHVEVRRQPAQGTLTVISELRGLGLRVVGDSLRYSVACEGPAWAVRAALELPFVTRARLERFQR